MDKKRIAERLKMLKGGMSGEAFAERCGIPPSTMQGYLEGKRLPSYENINNVAKSFNVPPEWIAKGSLPDIQKIDDIILAKLFELDPEVIETIDDNGRKTPVVKTYDDMKHHFQFFCIHCRCWHFHGRGGEDYPYQKGRGGMAGDREAHCITVNSPFRKRGYILDVVGKLKDVKKKYKQGESLICPQCNNYYSAAFNACSCGYINTRRKSEYPELADLYQRVVVAVEKKELPNITPGPSMGNAHKIPIISWVQAGDWKDVFDPYQPGFAEDWVLTTETNHPNAFALLVQGDSMEPEFLEGDIVTVDPGRDAINGSYVIAKNGEEATFKQLVIDGSNVYLKPLNARYPIKDITGIEIKIVGVVVEKRKRY